MGNVQIDSDAAFKAASDDAAKFLKEHPEKNPTVTLKDLTRLQGVPTWIVFWGNEKLGYRSFISGVDGKADDRQIDFCNRLRAGPLQPASICKK